MKYLILTAFLVSCFGAPPQEPIPAGVPVIPPQPKTIRVAVFGAEDGSFFTCDQDLTFTKENGKTYMMPAHLNADQNWPFWVSTRKPQSPFVGVSCGSEATPMKFAILEDAQIPGQ